MSILQQSMRLPKFLLTLSFLTCFSSGIASKENDPCPQLTQNLLNRLKQGGEQPPLDVCAQEAMAFTPEDKVSKNVTDWYQIQLLADKNGLPAGIKALREQDNSPNSAVLTLQSAGTTELFDFYLLLIGF